MGAIQALQTRLSLPGKVKWEGERAQNQERWKRWIDFIKFTAELPRAKQKRTTWGKRRVSPDISSREI